MSFVPKTMVRAGSVARPSMILRYQQQGIAARTFSTFNSSSSASLRSAASRHQHCQRVGSKSWSQGQQQQKRWQSSASSAAGGGQSWFKRMWDSPIGLKTVHFWAPVMKWALVIAGISDFARPAEKLSVTQNVALTATGLIWTRWCLIIKPKNYLLAAVNFFLGCVGVIQVGRIAMYNMSHSDGGVAAIKEEVKQEVENKVEAVKS